MIYNKNNMQRDFERGTLQEGKELYENHWVTAIGFDLKGRTMQGYNCIMVYNVNRDKLLFCKRVKEPYKGLYNFVGGKIDPEEDGFVAAYRELYEETGISEGEIKLNHMMDFTYYNKIAM